jgi:WD40 repeat protein
VPPASEWREELAAGVRSTHTFVPLLSPSWVASDYCRWELEQAVELGKRLVPVVIEDVDAVPEELGSRQYVFMREGDDFDQALGTLTEALGTDLEWVKEHRHWLMEALRWDDEGRDRSLLLRGRDLKAAEGWLARQAERTEPRPTQLQTEFLLASRVWETRRLRTIAVGIGIALAVSTLLGILALLQRNDARNQAAIARSRELAVSSTSQLPIDPERSLLLAIEAVKTRPTTDAKNALRRAVLASRLRAEVPTRSKRIGALVNTVAFSADGRFVAGGSNDGTVSVANSSARRGTRAVVLPVPPPVAGDPCSVFARAASQEQVLFSADGRFVAAVNSEGGIQLWSWPRPGKPVTSPFCLNRTTPPSTLDITSAALFGKTFPPAAATFAAGPVFELVRTDGQLVRWSWNSGRKPVLVRLARAPILAAAFSTTGDKIVVADSDGMSVRTTGGRRVTRPFPISGAYAVATNADGNRFAAASGGVVSVWRRGAGPPLVLRSPEVVRSIAMSPDGNSVAVGDSGNAVRVWDLARGGAPVVLRGSQGPVTAVAFSSDGKRIVSGADDGVLRIWAWDASRPLSLGSNAGDKPDVVLSSDGRLTAIDGLINARNVAVSRDGRRAVAAVAPIHATAVQVWDKADGSRPRTVATSRPVNAVALSADGRSMALAERGGVSVGQWPGNNLLTLGGGAGSSEYTTVALDRGGGRLAAAAYDGKNSTISVWSLPASGRSVSIRALGFVHALAFSQDGERLVAATSDGALRIWDLSDVATPIVLRGHAGAVNAAAFSPDGNEIVSGGHDGTVRIWELAEDGKSVTIPGPGGAVSDVAFTPDGDEVIAAGTRGPRVWTCDFCGPVDDVLTRAQRMATRTLTPEERALFLHER